MAHSLLERLLNKRKVKIDDLSLEEQTTFKQWQETLSEDLTVTKIAEFCRFQREAIEKEMGNLDSSHEKNTRLVLLHTVWGKIGKMIDGQGSERESLIKYLTDLIDKD